MIPTPSHYWVPSQPVASQSFQSPVSSFWNAGNVRQHLKRLRETVNLAKALVKELEEINLIRQSNQNNVESSEESIPLRISKILKEKRISVGDQELLSLEAANSLISTLRAQLAPFDAITSENGSWEERSMAVRLAQKMQKAKRNKRWKKKKRKRVAEQLRKEREGYDKADQEADEWRMREIAKDIARRKVESMKAIAKQKANEERRKLESELELVLVVEKLQELRSMRIQKLKKQGHFLPEEDDKFLQRVQAAVEEEERQAAAAADTDAAKDAIAIAEVSRKPILGTSSGAADFNSNKGEKTSNLEQNNEIESEGKSGMDANLESGPDKHQAQSNASGYDSLVNLPFEFYHYYHGSSNDMGTLIEVRRMWDVYIRPGGSRIPGHWVQPPPPANEIWASYLVHPEQ